MEKLEDKTRFNTPAFPGNEDRARLNIRSGRPLQQLL